MRYSQFSRQVLRNTENLATLTQPQRHLLYPNSKLRKKKLKEKREKVLAGKTWKLDD